MYLYSLKFGTKGIYRHINGIFPLASLDAGSCDPAVLLSGDSGIPGEISMCPGIPE